MHFVVLMNVRSGHHADGAAELAVRAVLDQHPAGYQLLLCKAGKKLPALASDAAALARAANGALIAAGGDGTINAVASAALKHNLPFGAIPLGTFNYFGREHGIPLDATAATRALLNASIEPKHVGWVNDRLFLINASLGLYAAVQEERESWKRQFGRSRWTAVLSGLHSLLTEPRKLTLEIESDGAREVVSTASLFVANNRLQMARIGLHAQALAGLDHGCLAAIVARPMRSSQLFAMAFRGALGRLRDDDNLHSFAFKRLTVRPRRDRFLKVATDGEVSLMRTPLVFCVGPQPLRVLIPAPDERVALQ